MDTDENETISVVSQRLQRRYPAVKATVVDRVVESTYHSMDDAPIRSFVGILVEKEARKYLEATLPQLIG